MADTDEQPQQFNSLKERIAALNQQKNFNSAGSVASQKPRPPPPPPPTQGRQGSERTQTAPAATLQNGTSKPAATKPAAPSVPQRPQSKVQPPALPRRDTQGSLDGNASQEPRSAAPPPLPNRTSTTPSVSSPSPRDAMVRRTTGQSSSFNGRRGSTSSELSIRSTGTTGTTASDASSRRVPPAFDPANLPPLPPTKRELEARAQEEAAERSAAVASKYNRLAIPSTRSEPVISAVNSSTITNNVANGRPTLPPRLPSRPGTTKPQGQNGTASTQQPTSGLKSAGIQGFGSKGARPASAVQNTKIMGFGSGKSSSWQRQQSGDRPPPMPARMEENGGGPPPVPMSSRPSAAQIDAANDRAEALAAARNVCLYCRDWSEPDRLAEQFPRESLPRNDPVGYLARGLCDPLPSYTDKARAIFTWFHHNIAYDTVSFFGNCVKHMAVEDTIFSGLAVCQGYAETYKAIAQRAGLDCVVVGGHGKGFGHAPLKKGERCPPPKPDGHAWNAVRIDGGVWQLLDACWGAGHLDTGTNSYKKKFSPWEFMRTNEQFGATHFPRDPAQQHRKDGRPISWEEYFTGGVDGEAVTIYGGSCGRDGILASSVEPREGLIPVRGGGDDVLRFQFSKVCEDWKSEIHGDGPPGLLLLSIHGVDGRKDEMVPFETDGYWHWIDVRKRDLGAPGQSVHVASVDTMDGRSARGVSKQRYLAEKGRVGMSFSFLMKWELV